MRRLAIQVEDHELNFGDFEGEIPPGEYGAGSIRVLDRGSYTAVKWTAERITFEAHGKNDGPIHADYGQLIT